ncbi:MAG: bifunctional diaminohydroxyphosphoribosylaminopyrimidine deaminase/5-amino-6-(5-phosphoribosylamino)uracil reductase RibD [Tannerellaceae bacterium]|nr:bifunctional diaminohydroxyphosphoribosylaminopyrimidine deaminase/5-amino-6-(5-phosphoribosylamino)uracil reductase RibD [Tannerellaceae bacterium]
MDIQEKYMARCLMVAQAGKGRVAPNPMVGSVLVYDGKIIGEGFHRKYGGPHAEVNAIASVKDPSLLSRSTLYVNLEPCSHYGKTPPCTELIIRKKIPRVVIGVVDPFAKVAGWGIRMLKEAGIEVITGVMEKEATYLNRGFFIFYQQKRPYVILKWAQSADGFVDYNRSNHSCVPALLSSPETLRQVHQLRSRVSAIMVGTRTALLDNPSLSVRHWTGAAPVRVVLDRDLSIPESFHLLDGQQPTLVFTRQRASNKKNISYFHIDYDRDVLSQVLTVLYREGLQSLLVEGGPFLQNHFLQQGIWDEIRTETTPAVLSQGIQAPLLLPEYHAKLVNTVSVNTGNTKKHLISIYTPL